MKRVYPDPSIFLHCLEHRGLEVECCVIEMETDVCSTSSIYFSGMFRQTFRPPDLLDLIRHFNVLKKKKKIEEHTSTVVK